ncbi:MAG: tRNA (N6-threonylcarbamoyladenosine(37)-N6)-methyltransferase TrmO [Planctomycetota bacterium]
MKLTIIGHVKSSWKKGKGTPIQPSVSRGRARIEIDPPYREALVDLDGFDRIWVLTWLHQCRDFRTKVVPYRDTIEHGLFSTRAPARPNPIGLSCVIVSSVDPHSGIIQTGPLDLLDGTPVLDVKPYMPSFDAFPDAAAGWMDDAKERRDSSDGRFEAQ